MAKAFENPLLSHARMRQIYRALVELRHLSAKGSPGAKGSRLMHVPKGLEACWAASAIDLQPGDLAFDLPAAPATEYVRTLGTRKGSGTAKIADLRRLQESGAAESRTLPLRGSAFDRTLCAVGAAMAVKAAAGGAVVVAYTSAEELSAAEWKRLLRIAAEGDLPLLLHSVGEEALRLGAIARKADVAAQVPVIPVDASDAVAIYRVTQESLGRARTYGGAVVIEHVRSKGSKADSVKLLARQLLRKGIASEAWLAEVATAFEEVRSGAIAQGKKGRRALPAS